MLGMTLSFNPFISNDLFLLTL